MSIDTFSNDAARLRRAIESALAVAYDVDAAGLSAKNHCSGMEKVLSILRDALGPHEQKLRYPEASEAIRSRVAEIWKINGVHDSDVLHFSQADIIRLLSNE